MRSFNKITIALSLDENEETLACFRKFEFMAKADIYLVHMVQSRDYSLNNDINLILHDSPDIKVVAEQNILAKLDELKVKLMPSDFQGRITCECLFVNDIKKGFAEFAEKVRSQLSVVGIGKEAHRFGGFLQYQLHHSHAAVFIVKPDV